MSYWKLLIVSILVGLLAGLVLFGVLYLLRESFVAAEELRVITSRGGAVKLFVLIPAVGVGWLLTAAASRFTGHAGLALLPLLLMFLAAAGGLAIALVYAAAPEAVGPLVGMVVMTSVVTAVSASIFEWLNL